MLLFAVLLFVDMVLKTIVSGLNLYSYMAKFYILVPYEKVSHAFLVLLSFLNLVFSARVFFQLVRKNKASKYAVLLYLLFNVYVEIINVILVRGTSLFGPIVGTVFCVLWIAYFIMSDRVKETLIHPSDTKWITTVFKVGKGLMKAGFVCGLAFHIYSVFVYYQIYGVWGLYSFLLGGISEGFMWFKSMLDAETFYTLYCVLGTFLALTTFGISLMISYVSKRMTKDGFDVTDSLM